MHVSRGRCYAAPPRALEFEGEHRRSEPSIKIAPLPGEGLGHRHGSIMRHERAVYGVLNGGDNVAVQVTKNTNEDVEELEDKEVVPPSVVFALLYRGLNLLFLILKKPRSVAIKNICCAMAIAVVFFR